MVVLLLFAFIAGIVTILSPCILPVLPIMLSSSFGGGKKKPIGIVLGFVISFTFFTLFLTALVKAFHLPDNLLRNVAVIVILLFGISLLIPKSQLFLERLFTKVAAFGPKANQGTGFGSGVVTGLSLGLLWTPCVGPILGSIITLAVSQAVTLQTVLITAAYALGTAIPMFGILIGSKSLLHRLPIVTKNTAKVQKVFGVVMILVALAIFFNYDRKFQTFITTKFPSYGAGLTQIENAPVVQQKLQDLNSNSLSVVGAQKAPDFTGGTNWLNSPPLSINDLKGKVVLVDFWTYTCINCIRTLPYVTRWYDKYKDQGFVVIGVHSPEFAFEHNTENVVKAIKDFGIHYPVVQDNDFAIWRNYGHNSWPREYFIDKDGNIRKYHEGEGDYEASEKFIQSLLAESGHVTNQSVVSVPETSVHTLTPESYLGFDRFDTSRYGSKEAITPDQKQTYTLLPNLPNNVIGFGGPWQIESQRAVPFSQAKLALHFSATNVFLVMRPKQAGTTGKIRVLLDGLPITEDKAGADVKNSEITVSADKLYNVVTLGKMENHQLAVEFLDDNSEVYAFQFG